MTFEVLVFGNAVDNDAGTGLHMGDTIGADHECADSDGGVDRAREIEIADNARIRPALHRFERIDDLHRPDLRRTRHRARRQRGSQHIDRVATFGQFTRDL